MSTALLDRLGRRSGVVPWALTGLIMGPIAGLPFILFEMFISGFSNPNLFGPLRLISAIVLGTGALPPEPTIGAVAIIVGLIVHFILAALFGTIFGAIFGALASVVGVLAESSGVLVVSAAVGGTLLWLLNFYVIAPVAFPWFTMTNPVVQFFAHTLFYGAAFGLLLSWRLGPSQGRRSAVEE